MVSDDIVKIKMIHAGDIINKAAKYINGGGGGQAFMAVAGGNQPEGIPQALDFIKKTVSENLL
jgi:alanyl-tRNA synthetase